jgi:hypothetical protein
LILIGSGIDHRECVVDGVDERPLTLPPEDANRSNFGVSLMVHLVSRLRSDVGARALSVEIESLLTLWSMATAVIPAKELVKKCPGLPAMRDSRLRFAEHPRVKPEGSLSA